MLHNLRLSAQLIGYDVEAYVIDNSDGWRRDVKQFVPCYFKPYIIAKALQADTGDVLWVDLDCLMISRVDDMLGDCDVCVTLKRIQDRKMDHPKVMYNGYINAGVMAFRNNDATRSFMHVWSTSLNSSISDQDAINAVLLQRSDLIEYNELICIDGCRIKVAPCDMYNYFYFGDQFEHVARILHFKGRLRPRYYNQYAQMVLGSTANLNP